MTSLTISPRRPRISACRIVATNPRVLPSTLRTSAVRKSFSLTNLNATFLIVSSLLVEDAVDHHRREVDVRLVLRDRLELQLDGTVLHADPPKHSFDERDQEVEAGPLDAVVLAEDGGDGHVASADGLDRGEDADDHNCGDDHPEDLKCVHDLTLRPPNAM